MKQLVEAKELERLLLIETWVEKFISRNLIPEESDGRYDVDLTKLEEKLSVTIPELPFINDLSEDQTTSFVFNGPSNAKIVVMAPDGDKWGIGNYINSLCTEKRR